MHTHQMMIAVSLASAGMLALGCEHTDDRVANSRPAQQQMGATNTQGRESSLDPPVVNHLARARCDREQACNNVGDGKTYASRQVCMDQFRGGVANDLNAHQCPGGINAAAVQECLTAIGNEECGAHPVEAIIRIDKCRSGALCMK
jgi:hypothetical protein